MADDIRELNALIADYGREFQSPDLRSGPSLASARLYNVDYQPMTPVEQAEMVLSMIPGVGEGLDAAYIAQGIEEKDLGKAGTGLGALLLPGVGVGTIKQVAKRLGGADNVEVPDQIPNAGQASRKVEPLDPDIEAGMADDEIKKYYKVSQRQAQTPQLAQAADALGKGDITLAEFNELADAFRPATIFKEMPFIPTPRRIQAVLGKKGYFNKETGKGGVFGLDASSAALDGQRVGTRLDIPAYDDYDTWVVTVHQPGQKGSTIGYGQSAVLQDVTFGEFPTEALKVAKTKEFGGTPKSPFARMEGTYRDVPTENVYEKMQRELNNPDSEYIQVGMNPYRAGYFYDKATGRPILAAEEVLQTGPLVLAKKPKLGDRLTTVNKAGETVPRKFRRGGSVVERSNKHEPKAI